MIGVPGGCQVYAKETENHPPFFRQGGKSAVCMIPPSSRFMSSVLTSATIGSLKLLL